MNAPTLSKVEQLRARDGDRCWLCDGMLDFAAVPNSKKAPTLEHLEAKANGGGNALSNLVLTHPGCNKQLGSRPVAEKLRLQAKNKANREKMAAAQKVRSTTPVEEGGNLRPTAAPAPTRKEAKVGKANPAAPLLARYRRHLWRWQIFALGASGVAFLLTGVLVGMSLR